MTQLDVIPVAAILSARIFSQLHDY